MTETIKSLLRPLRNTLLSLSSPTQEIQQTPHERNVERNIARTAGFTFLKSMEELRTWSVDEEDAVQRAGVPLLPRPPVGVGKGAKVMVLHDFGTAYHAYEGSGGCIGVGEEEGFFLRDGEFGFVDLFVYFAHYLVSCPPAGWVNACHRMGVRVLGTFIVEPQMGREEVGGILERDERGFVVARRLGEIARWVGFEGWVVNIEGVFGEEVWEERLMVGFLEELRGWGVVIWYDALTTSNKIIHQNALTPSNLPFSLAAGHLLTNYAWNPSKITSSISLASKHSLDPSNIYFGIDIWAQNRPRSFWHPRITWPIFDGGGTNTGFAVAKCAEMGVSAGLFAPGWCWEHFRSTDDRRAAEGAMWRGEELGMDVGCDCKGGFWERGNVHRTEKYREFPVVKSARKYVVGTESGFWTDFEKAVVTHHDSVREFYGGHPRHAQLGCQGIMPIPVDKQKDRELWWRIDDERPAKLTVVAAKSSGENTGQRYMKLYNLSIRVEENTRLVIRYRGPQSEVPISAGFHLKFCSALGESHEFIALPPEKRYDFPLSKTFSYTLPPIPGEDPRIVEIGVAVSGSFSEGQDILEILELTIGPPSSFLTSKSGIRVSNVKFCVKGEGECEHARLTWQLDGVSERQSQWWSDRTGPVAYFDVGIDGVVLGRAYGLEFVLPNLVFKHWEDGVEVFVELTGVLFGGVRLTKTRHLVKDRRCG